MVSQEVLGTNPILYGILQVDLLHAPAANANSVSGAKLAETATFKLTPYQNDFTRFINLRSISASQNLKW